MAKKISKKPLIVVLLGDPRIEDKLKRNGKFNPEDLAVVDRLKKELSFWKRFDFIYLDDHATMFESLKRQRDELFLVINFCDEGYLNDPLREGEIPQWLEKQNIPYSGSGADCMKVCYDKQAVAKLASAMGISVPREFKHRHLVHLDDFPVILKPQYGDGGAFITVESVVRTPEKLKLQWQVLDKTLPLCNQIMIQKFLTGQDLTCGLIGNFPDITVLPIGAEDYSSLPANLPPIQGYEAKWILESEYAQVKTQLAQISGALKMQIATDSKRLFAQLGCRDYARLDWRLDQHGVPHLLEVNPNPGWCWDGHLAKLAGLAGMSYFQMLQAIIRAAMNRYDLK